jgi:hypothetical protein
MTTPDRPGAENVPAGWTTSTEDLSTSPAARRRDTDPRYARVRGELTSDGTPTASGSHVSVDAEPLMCTRCNVALADVPASTGSFTDRHKALPAVVYVDDKTGRLVVVPHRPDCWQLASDVRRITEGDR